jgi:hypothetical protein
MIRGKEKKGKKKKAKKKQDDLSDNRTEELKTRTKKAVELFGLDENFLSKREHILYEF